MKSTGITRKTDKQGRIVLPRELRRMLDIEVRDPLEIFVDDESIILKKYTPLRPCAVTGELTVQNNRFGNDNITLSPKGKKLLMKELKNSIL